MPAGLAKRGAPSSRVPGGIAATGRGNFTGPRSSTASPAARSATQRTPCRDVAGCGTGLDHRRTPTHVARRRIELEAAGLCLLRHQGAGDQGRAARIGQAWRPRRRVWAKPRKRGRLGPEAESGVPARARPGIAALDLAPAGYGGALVELAPRRPRFAKLHFRLCPGTGDHGEAPPSEWRAVQTQHPAPMIRAASSRRLRRMIQSSRYSPAAWRSASSSRSACRSCAS